MNDRFRYDLSVPSTRAEVIPPGNDIAGVQVIACPSGTRALIRFGVGAPVELDGASHFVPCGGVFSDGISLVVPEGEAGELVLNITPAGGAARYG